MNTPPAARPERRSSASWRHELRERGIDRLLWLLVPAFLFLVFLFIYPSAYGLALSFSTKGKSGFLGNYEKFFTDPYLRNTIGNTFAIALPASVFNVLAAIPLALAMRRRGHVKHLLNILFVMPITLGTVLVAQGLLNYLGPRGWVNRTLMLFGIVHQPVQFLHNMWGVVLSLIVSGFPFAFLLILSYASGIDPVLESAASTLGAGPRQRFWRITLPLLSPGIANTFCLTFVLAFSVFPSAVLLGNPSGDSHVLAIAAANAAFQQYDYPLATAISVITAVVELSMIAIVLGLRSRLYSGSTATGKG
ncbi:MAG: ABC transporter permease [Acetobacteraceae bacterium]